jgi:hypothetical protein
VYSVIDAFSNPVNADESKKNQEIWEQYEEPRQKCESLVAQAWQNECPNESKYELDNNNKNVKMLKKRVQNGNNSNNKVKLGRRTKFVEFFVHYII